MTSEHKPQLTEYEARLTKFQEDFEKAKTHKAQGNELFKQGEHQKALREYHLAHLHTKAINTGQQFSKQSFAGVAEKPMPANFTKEVKETHISLLNNMAACHTKLARWERVISLTTELLGMDGNNKKALFRRCQAYIETKQLIKARPDVEAGLKLAPTDANFLRFKTYLDKLDAHYDAKSNKKLKGWCDKL
eukprot:m.137152 g.137152  ORF g.137152 m.137152 type:complete len:191 (+) comp23980_c1_seq5:52-624(+)